MAPLKKITIFNDYYQNCSSCNYNEINIKYVIQLLHVNIVTIADYVKLYHGGGCKIISFENDLTTIFIF